MNLDSVEISGEGIAKQVYSFKEKEKVPTKVFDQKYGFNPCYDDEMYGRGGYTIALRIPDGPEYTVDIPNVVIEKGAKNNGLIPGCSGGCDNTSWFIGFDLGFAALAGIHIDRSSLSCGLEGRLISHIGSEEEKEMCKEAILRECGSRCSNFVYQTTVDVANRTETPGFRTFSALSCNWGSWVSCSIYAALSEWSRGSETDYAYADTLKKSKIYFVESDLKFISRPHNENLLNKGAGWDEKGSEAWITTCKKYGLRGFYMRQNVGIYALMYEIAMYNRGQIAWATMGLDSKFFIDYNLATNNSPCQVWWDIIDNYNADAIATKSTDDEGKYVAAYAIGCLYSYGANQVKQRREQEAGNGRITVRRGGVVWEDRELWTTFLCVDGGVSQMALMAGGCCDDLANCGITRVINDVIDLGYDWASGDMCNSILTLSSGKTGRDDLAIAYKKVASVLNRMSAMRPNSVAAMGIITTHAWQLSNTRHRIIACTMISNDSGIGPTTDASSWHNAAVLNKPPTDHIHHELVEGDLNGRKVLLTEKSWSAIKKDSRGIVVKLLDHGHCWLVEMRNTKKVATQEEIEDVEDILRNTLVEAAMEMSRDDFVEALWCWTLESWCASDMMWHAMIGSTAVSADRQIGSDRWDDENTMQAWAMA